MSATNQTPAEAGAVPRKYGFTGEVKATFGITLKRIRALVSFGAVVAGDIGGWIEKIVPGVPDESEKEDAA